MIVDVATVDLCYAPRPAGVQSVQVSPKARFDFVPDRTIQIGATPAQRQNTTCRSTSAEGPFCTGVVFFPQEQVEFRAESSTSAVEVDRALTWIHVVPDRVAVPGTAVALVAAQTHSGRLYLKELADAGLAANIRHESLPTVRVGGYVGRADPPPGTMLRPGETVTVTVEEPLTIARRARGVSSRVTAG